MSVVVRGRGGACGGRGLWGAGAGQEGAVAGPRAFAAASPALHLALYPALYPARPAASQCHRPGPAMLPLLGLCLALPFCAGSLEEVQSWGDTSEQVSGVRGGPRRAPDAGCRPFPPPPSGAWLPDGILDAREGGFTPISCHIVPPPPLCPQPSARELPHLLVPRGERLAGEVSCRIVSATSKSCRTKSPWLLLPARVSASFLLFISEPESHVNYRIL